MIFADLCRMKKIFDAVGKEENNISLFAIAGGQNFCFFQNDYSKVVCLSGCKKKHDEIKSPLQN